MPAVRVPIVGLTALLGLALAAPGAHATGSPGARAAGAAPVCEPTTLNTSATLGGSVTVSPLPGSRDASPQTQISFLGVPKGKLSGISVVGSRTGAHSGRFKGYSGGDGASFVPSRPF